MADDAKCLKCAGEMIEGFVIDRSAGGAKFQQMWVEGIPESSFWSNGLKTAGRTAFYVQSMRCASCGFLEFYAAAEVDADALGSLFGD